MNTNNQKALNFTKEKGKTHMASSLHSFHEKKNHVFCILILRMFLIMLIILVMIVLLFQSVMMVSLLLALCLLHLVILIEVKLGAMFLMSFLMRLRIGMHRMDLLFYSILLMHPM